MATYCQNKSTEISSHVCFLGFTYIICENNAQLPDLVFDINWIEPGNKRRALKKLFGVMSKYNSAIWIITQPVISMTWAMLWLVPVNCKKVKTEKCENIDLFLFEFLTQQTESCLFLASSFYEHHWSPEQPCPFPATRWFVPDHRTLRIYPSPGITHKYNNTLGTLSQFFIYFDDCND